MRRKKEKGEKEKGEKEREKMTENNIDLEVSIIFVF